MKTVSGLSWPLCAIAVVLACSLESPVSHQKGAAIADNALTSSAFVAALPSPPSPAVPSRAAARRAAEEHKGEPSSSGPMRTNKARELRKAPYSTSDAHIDQWRKNLPAHSDGTIGLGLTLFPSESEADMSGPHLDRTPLSAPNPQWTSVHPAANPVLQRYPVPDPAAVHGSIASHPAGIGQRWSEEVDMQDPLRLVIPPPAPTFSSQNDVPLRSVAPYPQAGSSLMEYPLAMNIKNAANSGTRKTKMKAYNCPYRCQKVFSKESSRLSHMVDVHEQVPADCPLCKKQCNGLNHLNKHLKNCTSHVLQTSVRLEDEITQKDHDKAAAEEGNRPNAGADAEDRKLPQEIKVVDVLKAVRTMMSTEPPVNDEVLDAVSTLTSFGPPSLTKKIFDAVANLPAPERPCHICLHEAQTQLDLAKHIHGHYRDLSEDRQAYAAYADSKHSSCACRKL